MSRRTCDLDIVTNNRALFSWGEVITFHEVGPYTIIEYYPWMQEGHAILTGEPNYDERSYHGYISGKNTSQSWDSLDAALVGLIARRREGPNAQAATYFMRMVSGAE